MNIFFLNVLVSIFVVGILAQDKETIIPEIQKNSLAKEPFLEAKFKNNIVNKGEPILLLLTLKNTSDDTIIVSDSRPERLFDIIVKNTNGLDFNLKKEAKKRKSSDIIMGREMISLKPREEMNWQINLNTLYNITLPNSYIVDVKLPKYHRQNLSQKTDFTSTNFVIANTVKFKLVE